MGPLAIARLAWRNLWRNRRRTLLTLVAISFGFFLAVFFTALQDRSFSDMIDLAARLGGGHVVVQDQATLDTPGLTHTVTQADSLAAEIRARPDVKRVVSRITGPAMLATAGHSYGIYFMGVDPAAEDLETLSLLEAIREGAMPKDANDRGVVLGERLARNLEVGLGDKVVATMMDRQGEIASVLLRVSGIVRTGSPTADGGVALMPIGLLRTTLGYGPEEATQVAIFISDSRHSPQVRDAVAPLVPPGAVALTWDEVQGELAGFIALKVGGARFMELVIMILVAASIFNTLLVSVLERVREFGIMLAIGHSPGQIFALIMAESGWLALVGVVVGSLIALGPYLYLVQHPIDVSQMTQGQSLDIAGVGMPPLLRIGIFPEHLAVIMLAVVSATMLSGLYPAWKAGRTVPVDSIKLV